MSTNIYQKAIEKYPFDPKRQDAYLAGAEDQKFLDLRAAQYAFDWYVREGKHLKYERALELFKQRFHGYLHNETKR